VKNRRQFHQGFYELLLRCFPFAKNLKTQTLSIKKASKKTISREKDSRKMLVKLKNTGSLKTIFVIRLML
jgi:hypothetical protein